MIKICLKYSIIADQNEFFIVIVSFLSEAGKKKDS